MPAKREDAEGPAEVTRDLGPVLGTSEPLGGEERGRGREAASGVPASASGESGASRAAGEEGVEEAAPRESAGESLEKKNRRFTAWRRKRPFGAGLVMMFAGAVIMTPAYLAFEISNIQVQISTISGVSTLIIGVLLIVCGFLTWFRGEGRILTGVVSLLLGIVALPTSNFGGFGLGTFLALIGGALALSWTEEEKEPRERRRRRRRAAGGGAAAAAVAVAVAVTMVGGAVTQPPEAEANPVSLPRLEDVIPFLPKEEERPPEQTAPPAAPESPAPQPGSAVPGLPGIPGLPSLDELRERGEGILNGDFLEEIGKTPLPPIPGIDLAAPEPIGWTVPPSGNRYTVMTDKTSLVGNVKFSYVTIDTAQGPRQGIRIDADHAILDNLSVRFPGDASGVPDVWKRSGPGVITTLNGNFHIIVHALEVTPQVAGLTSPVPLSLSADMPPEELKEALHTLGVGVPDALSGQMVMLNGTMDTYYISSDDLIASPETTFGE
ncbi:DUF6114 domain-containing protein [Corynebacterium mastitidis]